MSYTAAIAHLNGLIPELFTAPGPLGSAPVRRKFSLHEIGLLCAALGNPQSQFPSVLIAGTNGKGSTAATLASIAQASGLRTGLYTSPHLDRVNERIQILLPKSEPGQIDSAEGICPDGQSLDDESFARLYFRTHDAAQQLVLDGILPTLPSYFELLTALAFLAFAEAKIDLAVLEVGMGGRLDATNIVSPLISVITDISLDHQEWLGHTIAEITREKTGILRPNGTLVTLPQHPHANQAIGEIAVQLNVRAISAADYMPSRHAAESPNTPYSIEVLGQHILVDSPLKGAHQHRNIALAIATAVELAQSPFAQSHSLHITPATIEQGIRQTSWPGRLERLIFPNQPEFLLDVAHNPAGAWALRSALSSSRVDPAEGDPPDAESDAQSQSLVFACLRDKPLREMTQILFPLFDQVILAPIHSPRATDMQDLLAAAHATGVPAYPAATVAEALDLARSLTPSNGRIVISGSVYLVGEARHLLLAQPMQDPQP